MSEAQNNWKKRNRHRLRKYNRAWYHRRGQTPERKRRRQLRMWFHTKKRTYGAGAGEYIVKQRKKQKGRCNICRKRRKLVLDHCHRTGKFRKLICHTCNSGIGFLKDDLRLLRRAIRHLKESA